MFAFTRQERQVILFVAVIGLVSICVRFAFKTHAPRGRLALFSPDAFKVSVNEAGMSELVDIAGISSSLAKNILAYRRDHGPLRSIEELKEVKGVGEKRFEKLKEVLIVE